MLRQSNLEELRNSYMSGKPYPFVKIENFLDTNFAQEISDSYPSFDTALVQGKTFTTANERKKVQITNSKLFPAPVAKLNDAISSPQFLSGLSYITGIPDLLADEQLIGGGMHITGPGGRLDVHVDFNYMEERKLHRRINLLLYLNPVWHESWGGDIQFWDKNVRRCEASFLPALNRCVIFETSNISYHGVTPVSAAASVPRQSFATYYYTKKAPADWDGTAHSTIFKARPQERFRKYVSMPTEAVQRKLRVGIDSARRAVKNMLK
jgi:Rps23 Pro-64 3,4-dihydroxylase Tpa1-like proline 4-hydroxylase